MSIVKWNDEFKTDVCGVDCQRKALIRMLSGLYGITEKSRDREVVLEAAGFFADFAVENFQCEEKLMRDHGYPTYESHKKQHDEFIKRVSEIVKQFNETGDTSSLTESIQDLIVPWLTDHFTKTDKEMAGFIVDRLGGRVA